MGHQRIDQQQSGGSVDPWHRALAVAIDRTTAGSKVSRGRARMTEMYLVARSTATAHAAGQSIVIGAGEILIAEPSKAIPFADSSADHRHLVVRTPALSPTAARADHRPVPRARLGLA